MKFENKGKWTKQMSESQQKNEDSWRQVTRKLEYKFSVSGKIELSKDKDDGLWYIDFWPPATANPYYEQLKLLLSKKYKTAEEAKNAIEKRLKDRLWGVSQMQTSLGPEEKPRH